MSKTTAELMKQLRFITMVSNLFVGQQRRLTGQMRVLQVLNEEDGLIQSQLAEVLDLRPSSLAELLKKMEQKETISRIEDSQDKRIKRVYLTEKGRKKIQEQLKHAGGKDRSEAFFAGLDEAELEQFETLLKKIPTAWDEKVQQQASRFVDPMDRMDQMKELQQAFADRMGTDWKNLSRAEQRDLRNKMRAEMKDCSGFDRANRDFSRQFNHGFGHHSRNFWQNPFETPKEYPKNEKIDEEDWQDF